MSMDFATLFSIDCSQQFEPPTFASDAFSTAIDTCQPLSASLMLNEEDVQNTSESIWDDFRLPCPFVLACRAPIPI